MTVLTTNNDNQLSIDLSSFKSSSVSSCSHISSIRAPSPSYKPIIYKEECTLCYNNDIVLSYHQSTNVNNGINVCLICYNGACNQHTTRHYDNTKHSIILNVNRVEIQQDNNNDNTTQQPKSINDMLIQSSQQRTEYITNTHIFCIQCKLQLTLDNSDISNKLQEYINTVLTCDSANKPDTVMWDDTPQVCSHTNNLQQDVLHKVDNKQNSKCNDCDLTSNLWLCMVCGNLGCGRSQAGSTQQGNSHALKHYDTTKHAVALKLGTIGGDENNITADIYCYQCDNTVLDSKLQQHLTILGIIAKEQTITEKTTTELSLEQNLTHNWNAVIETDGSSAKLLYGELHTGLSNLGNTCYMASVLQVLFSIDKFKNTFYTHAQQHIDTCNKTKPWECYACQFSKLALGLLSGIYSPEPTQQMIIDSNQQYEAEQQKKRKLLAAQSGVVNTDDNDQSQQHVTKHIDLQPGIKPQMFKKLYNASNAEFSSNRQQDSLEYLHYLIDTLKKYKNQFNYDINQGINILDFKLEDRLQCKQCQHVRYKTINASEVQVPIVKHDNNNNDQQQQSDWNECINAWLQPTEVEYNCSQCKQRTIATTTQRLMTYPDVLLVQMRRFIFNNWIPAKDDTPVLLDADKTYDFKALQGKGKQSNEQELPDDNTSNNQSTVPQINQDIVQQLSSMGFSQAACERATLAVQNSNVEDATNWLFAHMDDADINTPLQHNTTSSSNTTAVSQEALIQLESMGFDRTRCEYALSQTDNNVERACDWLFSHMDEPIPTAAGNSDSNTTTQTNQTVDYDIGCSEYELVGYVTHLGKSVHSGHYVAHVKRNGQWVLFNDNKVSEVTKPAQQYAYLYFFQRKQK